MSSYSRYIVFSLSNIQHTTVYNSRGPDHTLVFELKSFPGVGQFSERRNRFHHQQAEDLDVEPEVGSIEVKPDLSIPFFPSLLSHSVKYLGGSRACAQLEPGTTPNDTCVMRLLSVQ